VIGFYCSFGREATALQVEVERAHGTAVVEASENVARTDRPQL
jgi:hypothetical protein